MTTGWNTPQDGAGVFSTGPGGLIAALPALLGFVPDDSLVALTVSGWPSAARVGHVLRVDLDGLDEEVFARIRPLLALAAGTEADCVLVVLGGSGADADRTALCARFAQSALPLGARLSAAFWAPSTSGGALWRALLGPWAQGTVADPRADLAHVVGALRGDVIASSREQLRELLRANPLDRAAVRHAARGLGGSGRAVAAAEREIFEAIGRAGLFATLDPGRAARFAVALRTRETRDRLVSATVEAATGPEPSGAELLWSRLVPMLPDDARAEAAALLALAWYARGRGAAARVALEEALVADPAHELAQLLEACLFAGVRPEALRTLVQDSG
ncbi:MAG: DUF4192 domain-containing protein [Segniliparus sp.]|uniref:DUF4192 domain-containing protein n=1 Tax=Segniliparus sp. TaxID=2804064 RepID=UPI003F30239E